MIMTFKLLQVQNIVKKRFYSNQRVNNTEFQILFTDYLCQEGIQLRKRYLVQEQTMTQIWKTLTILIMLKIVSSYSSAMRRKRNMMRSQGAWEIHHDEM